MFLDKIKPKGVVSFKLIDKDGNVKLDQSFNLVVSVGLSYIAKRMRDSAVAIMSHMALGTNATAAAASNTTLGAEVGRVALDSHSNVTTNVTDDSTQYVATFPPGTATGAITEAGLFNASTNGTMLARTVFPVINKQASDTLVITWKVTIS